MENLFKITKYQIEHNEVSFETIKRLIEDVKITGIYELGLARKNKKIIIPPIKELSNLCLNKTGIELSEYLGFNNVPIKSQIFKATNQQLIDGTVTFDELNNIFKELKIDSQYKLRLAKRDQKLKIPSYDILEKICQEKTGKSFGEFFNFQRSVTKPRQIERIKDTKFIEKLKKWCSDNDIKSQAEYLAFKVRPKEFPTVSTIIRYDGEDYFTKVLGLSIYKAKFEDKLKEDDFINKIKKWCSENGIDSISKYNKAKKPEDFPSGERIKQIYGYDYFSEVLEIKYWDYEFLTKEEARQVCLDNEIFTSNYYPKFYQKYNEQNEKKLPSDFYRHYKTNWTDFIQLSDTQLFILNSMSSLELYTYKLLYDRNIDFETEKTFDDCRSKNPLPFDFYLPTVKDIPVIIELDGEHHRTTDETHRFYSKKVKKHDAIKDNYCKDKNIMLIRIEKLIDIEPMLIEKINLNGFPKIKDLDWTIDFQTEKEVIESKLSKSAKVKLLLLMAERGKCELSDDEIIQQVNVKQPQFSGIKKELNSLGLINRPTDRLFSKAKKKRITELFEQGKNISEIVREIGYSNRAYLIKYLKEMGVEYKSPKTSKENAEKLRNNIIELHLQGLRPVDISQKVNASQGYIALLIHDYKISIGESSPDHKTKDTAEQARLLRETGMTMKEIAKQLGTSTQHLYKCLRWTEYEMNANR